MAELSIRPATHARFDDLALVIGPKRADASVCWCLSHRIAYVGTRRLFERAGFTLAATTDAVSGGFPRVVMRKQLTTG